MRKLLIKWLFHLLIDDETYQGIDDRRIELWLQMMFTNVGFRDYVRKRDLQILKTLGAGVSETNYHIYLGQRLEILHLLKEVSRAHKLQEAVDRMKKGKTKEKNLNHQSPKGEEGN